MLLAACRYGKISAMSYLRRVLFYVFLGLYFIFCPLTILYALGYIFKPGSEQGLVRTGIIYISTAPPGASIYLGNRRFTRKTPAILRDLLPDNYSVTVYLKNHRTWAQTVPVEGEKATVLERILLFPDQWQSEQLVDGTFEDLIPIDGSRTFLLAKGETLADIFIYDWQDEKLRPLVSKNTPYRNAAVRSYRTIAKSSHLLFRIEDGNGGKFLWVESDAKESTPMDLTPFFSPEGTRPEGPEQIRWDPSKENRLFSFSNGRLEWVDTGTKPPKQQLFQGVRGYGLYEKMIYVLKDDGTFVRMNHNGEGEEALLGDPALGRSLFGEKGFFDVTVFSKDIILFLGQKGELLANRLPYRFVDEGVKGLRFYPKQEKVLVWTDDKIGVLDFSKEHEDEKVFERGPKLFWVFKKGKKIEQAFWVYEGSHVLFRDDRTVYLLELETYDKPHLYELTKVRKKSSVFYSEDSGKLYYLDPEAEALSSLEILPRRDLLLLPFPERKEKRKASAIEELS